MDDKALAAAFQTHSSMVVEWARSAGPAAVPKLQPYLKNADREQRLIAVDAIIVAGGPQAPGLLLDALDDRDEQVRINAASGLRKHLPRGEHERLYSMLTTHKDPVVRRQVAFIIGELDAPDALRWLNAQYKTEQDQDARDAILAALAKLKDGPARETYAAMLRDSSGPRIKELIDLSEYIDQPWVIKKLAPVLTKYEIAVDLSSHRTKLTRRSCDLAVDEIARLSKHEFSFPISRSANYLPPQLAEVIAFVDSLPA